MNIGIDVSLLKIKLAGMGIYVKEMVERISALDSENQYYLFTNADLLCDLNVGPNFRIIKKEISPHIVWLQVTVPRLLKKYKIDVFWQPDHILPPKIKKVDYYVTIHDLSGYRLHNVALKRVEIVFKLFMKRSCNDARKIITISEYTKKDIIETLNVDPEKINVIYNGESPYKKESPFSDQQINACMGKYEITAPYFLFVGTINPRKNVLTIVKAFHEFRRKARVQLVIAGDRGWNSKDVTDAIDTSEFKDDIIVTGYVSEDEKEILYRCANCFVFPSVLEGFGLPVLEAMSVGIPVITSGVSSLPEVGGEAAMYLHDYYDASELAGLMERVFFMDKQRRDELAEAGYSQAKKFSRQECAEKTLELITS